uniref:BZIP domain-containing protein n=1 Tax=Syphacia muris TaxID=451379 RepID=A0A0N5AG70_9BILA
MDIAESESCSSPSSSTVSTNGSGLNLLCSTLDQNPDLMDSSNSSEESSSPSPSHCDSNSSRRRSLNDEFSKNGTYWEKRKRNNDAAKRFREKRRINDIVIEQLTRENALLKNRLQQQQQQQQQESSSAHRTAAEQLPNYHESVIVAAPKYETPSLPAPSITTYSDYTSSNPKFQAVFPQFITAANPLLASSSTSTISTTGIPMLHLSNLQAALQTQSQYRAATAQISSGNGAFQPFQSTRENMIRRSSPDSSTADLLPTEYPYEGSSPDSRNFSLCHQRNNDMSNRSNGRMDTWSNHSDALSHDYLNNEQQQRPQLLLELLSTRRPSPLVPETRTDVHSGLINTSPHKQRTISLNNGSLQSDLKSCLSSLSVHLSTNKSDTDSMGSPDSNNSIADSTHSFLSQSSSSPSHSNAAIVKALTSKPSSKFQQQYMDRRRRNNEAAKRCRANRRAQFEFRSKRAQQLEQENEELRNEMSKLKQELEELKALQAVKSSTILRE